MRRHSARKRTGQRYVALSPFFVLFRVPFCVVVQDAVGREGKGKGQSKGREAASAGDKYQKPFGSDWRPKEQWREKQEGGEKRKYDAQAGWESGPASLRHLPCRCAPFRLSFSFCVVR